MQRALAHRPRGPETAAFLAAPLPHCPPVITRVWLPLQSNKSACGCSYLSTGVSSSAQPAPSSLRTENHGCLVDIIIFLEPSRVSGTQEVLHQSAPQTHAREADTRVCGCHLCVPRGEHRQHANVLNMCTSVPFATAQDIS